MLAAHADWSSDPRKRWLTLARREAEGWRVAAPRPVGNVPDLLPLLLIEAGGASCCLGVDFPLGLPRVYAERHVAEPDFPAFLRGLAQRPDFFRVAMTLAEVSADRPFYPQIGARGMTRAAHAAALDLPDAAALSRAVDRATAERPAGAPLFWTLGPNQSGKAAIAAWRDLLLPAFAVGLPLLLWPFDGPLTGLLRPGTVTVAETYPAQALRVLGLRLAGSKRRQADRAALAPALSAAMRELPARPAPDLAARITDGFGADSAGEDRFDSLLGVLNVIAVLEGKAPDTVPDDPAITRWEGWVLGQAALPASYPA